MDNNDQSTIVISNYSHHQTKLWLADVVCRPYYEVASSSVCKAFGAQPRLSVLSMDTSPVAESFNGEFRAAFVLPICATAELLVKQWNKSPSVHK